MSTSDIAYRVCVYTYNFSSMRFLCPTGHNLDSKNSNRTYVEIHIKDNVKFIKFVGGVKFKDKDEIPIKRLAIIPLTSTMLLCSPIEIKRNPIENDLNDEMDSEDDNVLIDLNKTFALEFKTNEILNEFLKSHYNPLSLPMMINDVNSTGHINSMDTSVVQAYFQYYGKMSNQMNMLQDYVRTSAYQKSMMTNQNDFLHKIVMDIGAGSGILSFFAAQAGAKRVYAVEASNIAKVISLLAERNEDCGRRIKVINKILEDIKEEDVDEKIDVLVSEPIGIFLFNERMIETYLTARDRFLKPGGCMYPNRCTLSVAPFSDAVLYADFSSRSNFWRQTNFYGLDLSATFSKANDEQFRQPIIDYVDPNILVASPHTENFDFQTIQKAALKNIEFSFEFLISYPCLIHGLAGWFDVFFEGCDEKVCFSTSPGSPSTHWYQIRFLLKSPLAVNCGQVVRGKLQMNANNQQSYFVFIKMNIVGTDIFAETTTIDLKEQDYRYYTNPSAAYIPNYYFSSSANSCYSSSSSSSLFSSTNTAISSLSSTFTSSSSCFSHSHHSTDGITSKFYSSKLSGTSDFSDEISKEKKGKKDISKNSFICKETLQ